MLRNLRRSPMQLCDTSKPSSVSVMLQQQTNLLIYLKQQPQIERTAPTILYLVPTYKVSTIDLLWSLRYLKLSKNTTKQSPMQSASHPIKLYLTPTIRS